MVGIGFGQRRLIRKIVEDNWKSTPEKKIYTYNDLLYIFQEMFTEEGKAYQEGFSIMRGYNVFRSFAKLLLYRNIANYDSMVLITSDKGCITGDCLLDMPRDLKKYPKGIPLKDLDGKGPIYVYSFNNKTKKLELKSSDGVEFVKEDDVYELELNNGMKIKATGDHPFMLANGKYKKLKELKNNDYVFYFKDENIFIGQQISIKHLGKQKVYDVVNVRDNHNFIVNGFVVSNTGKSSAAMMLAREHCKLLGIKFNPARHIAYNNADMMNKIDSLNKFEPIIADESIRFALSSEWSKKENKELKKKLAQVRTKHLLFILCFPLKVLKVEKTYLESFTNYWIDLFGRGVGAIYVKDKNPAYDSWKIADFKKIGSYTEFTNLNVVRDKLKKHGNFWQIIKFPKPPEWLYKRYLKVREKNVYDDENVLKNISKEDIHRAALILSLKDILMQDTALSINRVILHIKNEYDISLSKQMVQAAIEDSAQLISKVREQAIGYA